MLQFLSHFFLPHWSNNHRAKLLHHSSILVLIATFFIGQAVLTYIRTDYPAVLGSSIDVSTEELLILTNEQRAKQNIPPLVLNEALSRAAAMKAGYMFEKNFWAHNGPEGTTPWYFIKKSGYEYTYAGENLARGFTESSDVMEAWMNSPTHKENIMSPNYADIGFAIQKGSLLGEDTVLIVEMFGSSDILVVAQNPSDTTSLAKEQVLPAVTDRNAERVAQAPQTFDGTVAYTIKSTSLLSSRVLSSGIAYTILGAFIFVLCLDVLIIQRKKIIRGVGHNIDHIFFFVAFLVVVLFSTKGLIV